jgi:O-acetyl-ADP-ribose deacetylase (regulator of RNase III)
MGNYKEINGNLITLSLNGEFDVITHGCNCQCVQGAGLAPQMVKHFRTDTFKMEKKEYKGDINKLGTIDYEKLHFSNWDQRFEKYPDDGDTIPFSLYVVNSYTQYHYGKNHIDGIEKPLDYEALTLCLRKINFKFKGKRIGLPGLIGCGLAGGDSDIVKKIIKTELKDCDVTIVYLKKD